MDNVNEGNKKCGYCGMDISAGAGRCPYCGSLTDAKADREVIRDPVEAAPRAFYAAPPQNAGYRKPLSNGLKVFLTILFTLIPGLGQLAGIITGIVFMNADDDYDRKSFGVALLVASIVLFVLSCIGCFVLVLLLSINQNEYFYGN